MRRMLILAAAVLLAAGCGSGGRGGGEREVEVTLADLPPAVRDALSRESGGSPVGRITREREGGRTVYEARITQGAKTWDVEVDEDGKVLEREEVGKGG